MEFTESNQIIKYDEKLVLSKDLNEIESNLIGIDSSFNIDITLVPKYPSFIDLAQFSSLVYKTKNEQEDYLYHNLERWILLSTAKNASLYNGYFGAAYYHPNKKQIVIAHRGTTYNGLKKAIQNVFVTDIVGIYFDNHVAQVNSAATFTHIILEKLSEVSTKFAFAHFEVFITGHSLGGWLAQLTTFTSKYLRLSNNVFERNDNFERYPVQTVVFDSPGCKNALSRLQNERYPIAASAISTLNITTYISGPSRINSVNEHVGTIYEISRNLDNHSIDIIIKELQRVKSNSNMYRVVDWPIYSLIGDELSVARNKKKTNAIAENSRYKTLPVIKNECSINVFTKSEQKFLFGFKLLRDFPSLSTIDDKCQFNSEDIKFIITELGTYDIDNYTFTLQSHSQSLENFIPILRLVLKLDPRILEATTDAMNTHAIRKRIYQKQSSIYISSHVKNFPLNFDINEIESFERDEPLICQLPTRDTLLKINKMYQKLRTIDKYKNDINEYVTFFELKHLLFVHSAINLKEFLTPLKDHLLIVECKRRKDQHFYLSIQEMLNDIKTMYEDSKLFTKVIFVTHIDDTHIDKYLKDIPQLKKFDVNDSFKWSDLSMKTKTKLLELKVNFQGGQENANLKELIPSDNQCDITEIFDDKTILSLIDDKATKEITTIGMNIQLFNNFETCCYKIFDKVSKKNVIKLFESNDNLLFIGGMVPSSLSEDKQLENLKDGLSPLECSKTNKSLITFSMQYDSHKEFEKICLNNLNKTVYWLDQPTPDTILCQQVFYQNFYFKREFTYMREIVLDNNIVDELINEKLIENYIFVNIENYQSLENLFKFRKDSHRKVFRNNFDSQMIRTLIKINEETVDEKLNVHYINVDKNQNLIWNRSYGSLETIYKYIKKTGQDKITTYANFNEEEFCERNEKIVIISDEPGMGKSTTLTSLSTKLKSSWIIRVNFKDCSDGIAALNVHNLDIKNVLDFFAIVEPETLESPLTMKLLKFGLMGQSSKKVYIFFDGFDEIKEEEVNKKLFIGKTVKNSIDNGKNRVINLLKFLRGKTNAYIVVTTRDHTRKILENNLSVFATMFKRIEASDQVQFLMNFWNKSIALQIQAFGNDEIKITKKYAEALLENASKIFGTEISNFIGVPLQLRMLAEIFSPKIDSFKLLNSNDYNYNIGNIGDVYTKYIDRKVDIYLKEKVQVGNSPTIGFKALLNESFKTYHRYFAFQLLFPRQSIKFCTLMQHKDLGLEELYRIGIVKSASGGKDYEFVHRTFAEYFGAQLLYHWLFIPEDQRSSHIEKIEEFLITEILLQPENRIIRLFLDCLLPSKISVTNAVKKNIDSLWKTNPKLFFNKQKQSPLHILAAENLTNLIKLIPNVISDIGLVDALDANKETALFIGAKNDHSKIVEYLLAVKANANCVNSNGHTARYIGIKNKNLELTSMLISNGANSVLNDKEKKALSDCEELISLKFKEMFRKLKSSEDTNATIKQKQKSKKNRSGEVNN